MHPVIVVHFQPPLCQAIDSRPRPHHVCPASGPHARVPLLAVAGGGQPRPHRFHPSVPVLGPALIDVPVGRLARFGLAACDGPDTHRRGNLGSSGGKGLLWPSAGGMSWAGGPRRLVLHPWAGWSSRGWLRHSIGLVHGCCGAWTRARRIAVPPRRSGCLRSILVSCWSIHRSTPVGSSKSKSPAPSSNARSCPPMTLPPGKRHGSASPCTQSCRITTQHLVGGSLTVPH
jgi:hypothetical protein